MNEFDKKAGGPISAADLNILQVNVGLQCNQSCVHCHLSCSPQRVEAMQWETMERIITLADRVKPSMVDITGGAPELNPDLKRFILALGKAGHAVQVRTNLSVMEEDGYTDFPRFFADNRVGLVASLPCYLEENVSKVRGEHCFSSSLTVLRRLNELGYGTEPELTLDLVYNPDVGTSLPPSQGMLEGAYKKEMKERYGVVFSRLFTITNVPIGRYLDELRQAGSDGEYMEVLTTAFNPSTVDDLMCRHQVNIGWDGRLYDCDFNQALGLPVNHGAPDHIDEFDLEQIVDRQVVTGNHCFACTAGAGSSCGGALDE